MNPTMLLAGKRVIVTGVGAGMSSKIALEAAREGASLVLAARSVPFLAEIVAQIEADGGQAIAVPTDITQRDQCERLAAKAVEKFGGIDGLVNSAYRPGGLVNLEDLDIDVFRAGLETTVLGTLRVVQAVLPVMKAQRAGSIVNISSQAVRKALAGQGDYAAAKAAVSALSRQLALELGPYGIRVNSTVHGWMLGSPVEAFLRSQEAAGGPSMQSTLDGIAANLPLRAVPTDTDCARTVLMFLSDYTSQVTGASLDVNGGDYMAQ